MRHMKQVGIYPSNEQRQVPHEQANCSPQKATRPVSPTQAYPGTQNSSPLTRSNSHVTSRSCRVTSCNSPVTSCHVRWVSPGSGGRRRSWRRWRRFGASLRRCLSLLCCLVEFWGRGRSKVGDDYTVKFSSLNTSWNNRILRKSILIAVQFHLHVWDVKQTGETVSNN